MQREEQQAPPHGWEDDPGPPRRRRRLPLPRRRPGRRRRFGFWRVLRWLVTGVVAWLAISLVLFLVSAQIQSASVSDAADAELGGGRLSAHVAEHGVGARLRRAHQGLQGAGREQDRRGRRARTRSCCCGSAAARTRRSRSRATPSSTSPGSGQNKINAAYAIGGPALAIRTVENYLGIPVNHLIEVNFENFPQLIDALGGVDYRGGCVVSRINGGFKNGGYTLRLKAGEQEIDGKQALASARTRKNECNPKESDLTRARRQQKIMNSIKDKVTSVETFVRLPWVAWAAPKAIRSDMSGPTLLGVVGAELTAGTAKPNVLKPTGTVTLPDGGAGLTVDDATKQRAVDRFLRWS